MRKAILLPALLLAACSNYSANLPSIKPYKMDIQQGNVVTPKMMMQLRPGMTKAQVRFVMGTPLIADSFHANRWDYFYRMQKSGKIIEQRRVILDFEDEKLKRVRGDVVPAGEGATEAKTGERKEPITLKPAGSTPKKEEKGLLDKLKFWDSDEEQTPAKPGVKDQPAPEEKLEALPPLMEPQATEPAPAPAVPKQERTPVTAPVAKPEPKAVPAPQPEAKPAPKVEPKPEPRKVEARPEIKPEPVAAPKPAAKPAPSTEPKQAPKPQEDLPSEEDPGYFERMLEKIGF